MMNHITQCVIAVGITLISFSAFAQDDDVVFIEPISADTLTTEAQPVGGWKPFLKMLEAKFSQGDTLGKKYRYELWPIQVTVSKSGVVEEVSFINHATSPIHRIVAEELKQVAWEPAQRRGVETSTRFEIWESIYINKRVIKARTREYLESRKSKQEK
jgi:hypothetical protein